MFITCTTYKFAAKVFRWSNFVDEANIFRLQNLKIKKIVAIKKHIICGSENTDSRFLCKITEESCYRAIWAINSHSGTSQIGSPDKHLKNKEEKTRINHDIVLQGTKSSMVLFTRLLSLFTESA